MKIAFVSAGMMGHIESLLAMSILAAGHESILINPSKEISLVESLHEFPIGRGAGYIMPNIEFPTEFQHLYKKKKGMDKWVKFSTIGFKQSRRKRNKQQKLSRRINRLKKK